MKFGRRTKSLYSFPKMSVRTLFIFALLSGLLVSLPILLIVKVVSLHQKQRESDVHYQLRGIHQTGPQKGALPTQYLAQLLDLSVQERASIYKLPLDQLTESLRRLPAISEAFVDLSPPNALYVNYTLRQPRALIGGKENRAVDDEGKLFPLYPFHSPKVLPVLYLPEQPGEEKKFLEASLKTLRTWEPQLFARGMRLRSIDLSYSRGQELIEGVIYQLEFPALNHQIWLRGSVQDQNQNFHRLFQILDHKQTEITEVSVIDLRNEGAAYLKPSH